MFEISTLRKGVWSMIFSGLTDLHIVLHESNIDQEYYCTNILETNVFKILKKKNAFRGSVDLLEGRSSSSHCSQNAETALRKQMSLLDEWFKINQQS